MSTMHIYLAMKTLLQYVHLLLCFSALGLILHLQENFPDDYIAVPDDQVDLGDEEGQPDDFQEDLQPPDRGSLADDLGQPEPEFPPPNPEFPLHDDAEQTIDDLEADAATSDIRDIQTSLDFIADLRTASLESSGMLSDDIERLRNPPCHPVDISDPDLKFSLKTYMSTLNASQDTYNSFREAVNDRYPEDKMLSLDQVKRKMKELTGVVPIAHDLCVNSCVAYTGPFSRLETCPKCSEPRYEPQTNPRAAHTSRQQYYTIPVGPQLQALYRDREMAEKMQYRRKRTAELVELLSDPTVSLDVFDDYVCGADYLQAVKDHNIQDNDICLMLSVDGAQLYRNKASDCWIAVWVVLELGPDHRFTKRHILPAYFVPGPNKPKNHDSCIHPSTH